MTHCVNVSQPLSPATLAFIQWVHVAEMGDKQQGHPLIETDLATAIPECLTFQQQGLTLTPHKYANVPREDQPAACRQVDYIGTPFILKGAAISLTRINMHSG